MKLFLSVFLLFTAPSAFGQEEIVLSFPTPGATPAPQAANFHPAREGAPGTVRLAFVGDVMVARKMEKLLEKKGAKWAFEACKSVLDDADLAVANLESPVGEGGAKYTKKSYYFKGRKEMLDALAYGGFGLVSLSNNHILDYGSSVMEQTEKALDDRGIRHVGLSRPGDPPDRAEYVKIRDVTLAFLAYCSVCPESFSHNKKRPGVTMAVDRVMAPEVRLARSKADFVIVMLHWGREHRGHNALQKKLALSLSRDGADLVIGSHPHVLQKMQRLGKGERTFVAYSLGNFLFDMKCKGCHDSCILKVDLEKGKRIKARIAPISGDSGRPVPVDPTDGRALKIKGILNKGYKNGRPT